MIPALISTGYSAIKSLVPFLNKWKAMKQADADRRTKCDDFIGWWNGTMKPYIGQIYQDKSWTDGKAIINPDNNHKYVDDIQYWIVRLWEQANIVGSDASQSRTAGASAVDNTAGIPELIVKLEDAFQMAYYKDAPKDPGQPGSGQAGAGGGGGSPAGDQSGSNIKKIIIIILVLIGLYLVIRYKLFK